MSSQSKLIFVKESATEVALEIRKTPGVCGGAACIGATRIPVWLIVSFIKQGETEKGLLQSYPQLTDEHLRLARDYYRHHKDEIDRNIREQDDDEKAAGHG
jgi:uncharacterized protein (DUF433 family)